MALPLHSIRLWIPCIAFVCLAVLFSDHALAQNCRQSINVDPSKVIAIEAWDGSGTTLVMNCVDAERLRGQIFLDQLAYLSQAQNITADRVNGDIRTALSQLLQLRRDLASVQSADQARTISVTLQSMKWLTSKTKLLICAGAALETSGGLGLIACWKPLRSFIKESEKTFEAFSAVSEAQNRAALLQKLITQMQTDYDRLRLSTINGSATAQQYSAIFDSLCRQVMVECRR